MMARPRGCESTPTPELRESPTLRDEGPDRERLSPGLVLRLGRDRPELHLPVLLPADVERARHVRPLGKAAERVPRAALPALPRRRGLPRRREAPADQGLALPALGVDQSVVASHRPPPLLKTAAANDPPRRSNPSASPSVPPRRPDCAPDQHHGLLSSAFSSASHAARCVACHGVRSHPVPVALVGECSIPVV